jgi:hypothetical protein
MIHPSSSIGPPVIEARKLADPIKKGPSPGRPQNQASEHPTLIEQLIRPSKERGIADKLVTAHRTLRLQKLAEADEILEQEKYRNLYNDLKMLRDKGVVAKTCLSGPWSSSRASISPGSKIQKPKWQYFTHPMPSAPTSQRPSSCTMKTPAVGSKVGRLDGLRVSILGKGWQKQGEQLFGESHTKPVCQGIRDRIKRWEEKPSKLEHGVEACREPHDFGSTELLETPIAARNNLFENPWSEEAERGLKNRGLDADQVQAIIDECLDLQGGFDLNNAAQETWEMAQVSRIDDAKLTAPSERERLGDAEHIIVREAQCSLSEPRPLRLLEMSRMIWLCKERFWVTGLG